MLTEPQCRYVLRRYVSALRRARSLIREAASPSVGPDRSLEKIDADAARYDPWLFSDECESLMVAMAALSDPKPETNPEADPVDGVGVVSPVDVMNFSLSLGAPPKVFKDEPLTPGDSKFWAVELPADVYQFVADPTLVFAPLAERRAVEECSFSSETMEAVGWRMAAHASQRLGVQTPVRERRVPGRYRLG